jgi:hypothetical protein
VREADTPARSFPDELDRLAAVTSAPPDA